LKASFALAPNANGLSSLLPQQQLNPSVLRAPALSQQRRALSIHEYLSADLMRKVHYDPERRRRLSEAGSVDTMATAMMDHHLAGFVKDDNDPQEPLILTLSSSS